MNLEDHQAYIDHVVKEEVKRQRAEAERAHVVEASRDRLLARKSAEVERRLNHRRGLFRRLCDRLADAWAMAWAMVICYGEALHLWVYEG